MEKMLEKERKLQIITFNLNSRVHEICKFVFIRKEKQLITLFLTNLIFDKIYFYNRLIFKTNIFIDSYLHFSIIQIKFVLIADYLLNII